MKYEVYEIDEGKHHSICICENIEIARVIAYLLAKDDAKGDKYFVTEILEKKDTFSFSVDWHEEYYRKDDKVIRERIVM